VIQPESSTVIFRLFFFGGCRCFWNGICYSIALRTPPKVPENLSTPRKHPSAMPAEIASGTPPKVPDNFSTVRKHPSAMLGDLPDMLEQSTMMLEYP